jgi:hypothetical protein
MFGRIFPNIFAKTQIFVSPVILAHACAIHCKNLQKISENETVFEISPKVDTRVHSGKISVHKLDVGPWRPRIPFSARKLKRGKGCLVQ